MKINPLIVISHQFFDFIMIEDFALGELIAVELYSLVSKKLT